MPEVITGTRVEVEFQAEKTLDPNERRGILALSAPAAKKAGRMTTLRPDWEEIKVARMAYFVERKFMDHSDLAERLLATEDAVLVEGNRHGDDFWGMVPRDGVWCGRNELGVILMRLREILGA